MPTTHPWILLTYKIPRNPTNARVFVWRALKQLGAVFLHDAIWVLPGTPLTRSRFEWLAAEIAAFGGEATVWEARIVDGERRELIQQFLDQVDARYRELMAELERPDADLDQLSDRHRQIDEHDYFRSELGERVRLAIEARRAKVAASS
jgi:hypothetical protein